MIQHKKRFALTTATMLLLFSVPLFAQDFSQDWGNYITYLNKPNEGSKGTRVDEFSGAANYYFGLHTFSAGGFSFPVGLSYNSTGVRVDDYASAVGMGWNLDAGGSIVKIVRGLDDDEVNGYGYSSNPNLGGPYKDDIYQGLTDAEKDYYQFNAFGFSGTFYSIDKGATFLSMNGDANVIERTNRGTPNELFTIIDVNGTRYEFGKIEETSVYADLGYGPQLSSTFKTGWLLTRVLTASKKEVLLTYEDKLINMLLTGINEVASLPKVSTHAQPGCFSGACNNISRRKIYNTTNGHRLLQITCNGESLRFIYRSTPRTDIVDDYALQSVELSRNGAVVSRLETMQQYISNRLMLTELRKISNNGLDRLTLASFDYYQDYTMPAPCSSQSQDGMGYFNNAPVFTLECSGPFYPSLLTAIDFTSYDPITGNPILTHWLPMAGANRGIGPVEVLQTLMLKKITDMYGKTEELIYARNNFHDAPVATINGPERKESIIHGLRVAKLIQYDLTNPTQKQYAKYDYLDEDGYSSALPIMNWVEGRWSNVSMNPSICDRAFRTAGTSSRKQIMLTQFVAYKRVKITRYTNENDIPTSTLGIVVNNYSYADLLPERIPPGGPFYYYLYHVRRYRWGNLESSTQYNKVGQVIQKTVYTYNYHDGPSFLSNYIFLTGKINGGLSNRYGEYVHYFYTGYKLLSAVEQFYYNDQAQLLRTEQTTFAYDGNKLLLEKMHLINNVPTTKSYYKRPSHYTVSNTATDNNGVAMLQLKSKRILAPVIEEVRTRFDGAAELITGADLTLYQYDALKDAVLPQHTFTYKSVNPAVVGGFNWLTFNNTGKPAYAIHYEKTAEVVKTDEYLYTTESKMGDYKTVSALNTPDGDTYINVSDAALNQMGYIGFEPHEMGRLTTFGHIAGKVTITLPCSLVLAAPAFTGVAALNLAACAGISVKFNTFPSGRTYKLRYWIKAGSVVFTGSTITCGTANVLRTAGDWELREHLLTGSGSLTVSGTGWLDDVVIYPVGGTYAYKTTNDLGDVLTECDETGDCLYYEYDDYNRLKTVRNLNKQVIKRMEYSIKRPY